MALDPNYKTNEDRVRNRTIVVEQITANISEKTNKEWNDIFTKARARFPYGPVNNLEKVFVDEQVIHNKMVVEMDHHKVGKIRQVKV
jgi:succinate--hydroxymethylglutarate CoA-transferase